MSHQALMSQPTRSADAGIDQDDPDRREVMLKLLQLGPETVSSLVRITGWGENMTQRILLQLVVEHKLKCVNHDNRRFYAIRELA